MDPMDYPDYEPTYADLGIDPDYPNGYSSDEGDLSPADYATDSDYAETEPDYEEDDSDHSEEGRNDMSSQRYFPDWEHLPWEDSLNTHFWRESRGIFEPSHHWAFIGQIVEDRSLFRPGYLLRDRAGKEVFVVFYLDNGTQANFKDFRVGRCVALYYPEKRQFGDGQVGIRIEEMSRAKVIPCTLDILMKADPDKAAASLSCAKCNKSSATLAACSACRTRYCSRDCQVSEWKAHKPQCAALAQMREWNERNWSRFAEYWC